MNDITEIHSNKSITAKIMILKIFNNVRLRMIVITVINILMRHKTKKILKTKIRLSIECCRSFISPKLISKFPILVTVSWKFRIS